MRSWRSCHRLPLNRPVELLSDGTRRRPSDSTIESGRGLGASGPVVRNTTMPAIDSTVTVPMVASRPTMNRRMAYTPPLGSHEIRPKRLHGVKHRGRASIEPVVAHCDGGRRAADRPQAV